MAIANLRLLWCAKKQTITDAKQNLKLKEIRNKCPVEAIKHTRNKLFYVVKESDALILTGCGVCVFVAESPVLTNTHGHPSKSDTVISSACRQPSFTYRNEMCKGHPYWTK